jgi:hypothetical protein
MKAEQQRLPRFAVLIDADNTSPLIAGGLFEEVAKFGEASVRRIYGDFSGPQLRSWSDILQKHAIDPYQQFAYTKGKNASDIALVIDAMDLLHSGRFEGFCLVSSDSDFTRLASRLREQGADVYGFGKQDTPESFRQACRRFIYTENLAPEVPASTEVQVATAAKRRHPDSGKGHFPDRKRGWVGQARYRRIATVKSGVGFRRPHLWFQEAKRPRAQLRRVRLRKNRGRPLAYPRQACPWRRQDQGTVTPRRV